MSGRGDPIRAVLGDLDPRSAHGADHPPEAGEMYLPRGHEAALDPERALVVADRGMGKSFWSGALSSDVTRTVLAARYPTLGLDACEVRLGFAGVDAYPGGPPSVAAIDAMMGAGLKPEVVWRMVVLRSARAALGEETPGTWQEYVRQSPQDEEALQLALREADTRLRSAGRRLVVVFDALDRLAETWPEINRRAQALLRVALALASYRSIRAKVFMRSDQANDSNLFAFADASKLRAASADLTWERRDLYGLLFTTLARSDESGPRFSALAAQAVQVRVEASALAQLPPALQDDEKVQERLFAVLAGPYMGADARRGKTYSWLHKHLADAHGRVSPRSFLIALRGAARRLPAPTVRPLDARGLEDGVREASSTRLDQLSEDYRWIATAVQALADLRVPCAVTEVFARWRQAGSIAEISDEIRREQYLGPLEFEAGGASQELLLRALIRIGVLELRPDQRVNMPDTFRVAAGALRKGGMRPRP